MQYSSITCENNFPTAKILSIVLVGILVSGVLTLIPFIGSNIVEARIFDKDPKFVATEHIRNDGGISIHGCDQSGTNGGISIYGCAKGGAGPNGGRGGIAIYGTANGGDGGTDGMDGVQGQAGSAVGPNAGTWRLRRNGIWW